MGAGDKVGNKASELKGRAKEAAGAAGGSDRLRREGRTDQTKARTKQTGEKLKDAGRDVKRAFKK
jgi:uncharacterized protein YjbJ (UPF0337 family)